MQISGKMTLLVHAILLVLWHSARDYAFVTANVEPNNPRACVPSCCKATSWPALSATDQFFSESPERPITSLDSTVLFGTSGISFPSGPRRTTHGKGSQTVSLPEVAGNENAKTEPQTMGKRGLAYNDVGLTNTFRTYCHRCSRAYNWDSSANELSFELSFVPMLWGTSIEHTRVWKTNMDKAVSRGSKAILSFNEPDRIDQANMSPEQAALGHIQYLNPYSGKVLIGAPSVTNSEEPGQGLNWLSAFFQACAQQEQGCAVDFCPVHWYSGANSAGTQWSADLLNHLRKAHEVCGWRPLWLTEFAVPGSSEEIEAFLRDVMPKLESLEYLTAYFYFMVSVGSLMRSETSLSPYGEVYASLD